MPICSVCNKEIGTSVHVECIKKQHEAKLQSGQQKDVSAEEKCQKVEYELVELVEVVTQDKEKWVKGAGNDCTDAALAEKVQRTAIAGEDTFRQYINLEKDVETQAKRHPEYSREITFKARIKRKDGKTEELNKGKVVFSFTCTKAANRAAADAAIWSNAELTGAEKAGFDSKGGPLSTTANTDDKGWTTPVKFFVSQYGGDQYEISAKLDPTVEGASGATPKNTKKYVVWRKFWYQMTYHDLLAASKPTKANELFAEVFAELVFANEKKFKKEDFTADAQKDFVKRTFLPEYMLKALGGTSIVANIGADSNIDDFLTNDKLNMKTDPDDSKTCPLKANLIVSKYQCDPMGPSALFDSDLTANDQEITITSLTGGTIVSKPALKKGAALVVSGKWGTKAGAVFTEKGTITDDCITISEARTATMKIKVNLTNATAISGSVPIPTALAPVAIRLQVQTAESYAGWAPAAGIVATYDGSPQGLKYFNLTVAHEIAHRFCQVPEPIPPPVPPAPPVARSLKDHPLQYVAHGGSGSHCRFKASCCIKTGNKLSRDASTTITETKIAATHKVVDGKKFIKGHAVTVKGNQKTVKNVYSNALDFDGAAFAAAVNDPVVQVLDYGPVNWNDKIEKLPEPIDGACVMYHARNDVKEKFCETCKCYLQLQDMSRFK